MGFLSWLSPFKWYAIGGIAAIVVGTFLWQDTHIHLLEHSLAEVTKARDTAISMRQIEHAEAERLAAAKKKEDQAAIDVLVAKQTKTLADLKDAYDSIARLRVDFARADKLRNESIAAFARGSGSADTAADCERRAAALGSELSKTVSTAEELAGDAESLDSTARSLLAERDAIAAAWPK